MENSALLTTPIYSNLINYSNNNFSSFHTPGHKNGKLFKKFKNLKKSFENNIFSMDLSVSCPEIDSLHKPHKTIKYAQDLASKTFNSDKTYFIVGGSTLANLIYIFSIFSTGDKVIVSRNIHKSIWAGIKLRQLKPVFVQLDYRKGITLNVSSQNIKKALEENQDAKGVIISSPTYEGICANIPKIAKLVHYYDLPLHVDEAWGGHFHFSEKFPISAMDSGADSCVQSTHKTLGAVSQASMLHIKSKIINTEKISNTYNYFTTTSPFYPLLASLDVARAILDAQGKQLVNKAYTISKKVRSRIDTLNNFSVLSESIVKKTEFEFDLTKITSITHKKTGQEISKILKQRFGIQCEKYDEKSILFLITIADEWKDAKKITESLKIIDQEIIQKQNLNSSTIISNSIEPQKYKSVRINKGYGQISADTIIPYPPGIPVILPGEVLTKEIISSLRKLKERGVEIHGSCDKSLSTIRILERGGQRNER